MTARDFGPQNTTQISVNQTLRTAVSSHLSTTNARAQTGTKGRKRLSEILSHIPAKIIGRAVNVSPDVARKWREGARNPSWENMQALGRAFPEVGRYILEGVHPDALAAFGVGDPEFMAGDPSYAINEILRNQRR